MTPTHATEDLCKRLGDHLSHLAAHPEAGPDHRLFDEATLVLPDALHRSDEKLWKLRLSLMRDLATSLSDGRQLDHVAIVNLLIKFFDGWSWAEVCEFRAGFAPYADGLAVGEHMVPFNKLMIAMLSKGSSSPADAADIARLMDAMQALVRLWLSTPDTGVAAQASTLLLRLLNVDRELPTNPDAHLLAGGQGLIWKRIFGDRDVYRVFFDTCSLESTAGDVSKNQRTVAQARLMEWLPKVGQMNWNIIARSQHREIEAQYGVQEGGLFDFASLEMVDYKDDVLMHRCLVDFFTEILATTKPITGPSVTLHDSLGLQYLIRHGLHARTTAMYLQLPGSQLDPVDSMFLYGPAANYLATYASEYPEHFLASQMPAQIEQRLRRALDISPSKWSHAESPKHDLHLMASLPRKALLPAGPGSIMALLPSKATNPDALNTLATLFHGPQQTIIEYPASSPIMQTEGAEVEEAASARALYFSYLAINPRFWSDIVNHANVVALKDVALAAIGCLTSVITANWCTKEGDVDLPNTLACPSSGCLAILSPPALEHTLPYLLKPAQTFANLVGGRGDAESAAYKIALAKFDALRALHRQLVTVVEREPGQGYEDILATLGKKIAEGPMSREGEIGGRIGTLDL